jgi:gamma-glutamyl:cysteine ligase YbdK (ATP-grasp superfamily)
MANISFQFGLEHENMLIRSDGRAADFTNTHQVDFDAIINDLPTTSSDYPKLRKGNVGIKSKRWYIEGLERFDETGRFASIVPKGIETRTPPFATIKEAVDTLIKDRQLLADTAQTYGYQLAELSFNPYETEYRPNPPLNTWEQANTDITESSTADIYMLTWGSDINLSSSAFSEADTIDIARKLTFYSPFIVPYSFSAPFYGGKLWGGYSARTYYRTGRRAAARAFVSEATYNNTNPGATYLARIPEELGRIEYKAFDTPLDIEQYGSLTALIKGLCLDRTLTGRSDFPDADLHRLAAREAFDNNEIYAQAQIVLKAATEALAGDPDREYLVPLNRQLLTRKTPAHKLISRYNKRITIPNILLGETS